MSVTRRRRRIIRRSRPIRCCIPASARGCAQCHGATQPAHVLQQHRQSEGCGARTLAHPVSRGNRLQLLPYVEHLRGRRLRADEHDPGHARLRQCHDLQHLPRGGLELLHGRGEPGAAGPAGRSHLGSNGGAERLQHLPHDGQLEQHGDARGPHAESGQSGLHRLSHDCAGGLYDGDARRECGLAHRHHQQPMRSVPWRHDAAHLVQQLHAEGCGAHALAYSVPGRHELRLLPFLEHLCGRQLRADEHDAGHSCVRGDHLRHLPREGPELLHGRGESRAAGPAGRSHLGSDGGAERLQHLPHHGELEQHDVACRSHAESGQSDLHRLSHRRAVQLRDARGQHRSSHRHHLGLHYLPRCAERGGAGVLSQLHAEGRDSFTRAHPDQHARRARIATRSVSPRSAARR